MNAREKLLLIEEWLAKVAALEKRITDHKVIASVAIVGTALAIESAAKMAVQVKCPPSSAVIAAAKALGVEPYASDCEIVYACRRAGSKLKPMKREADFERLVALRAARDVLLAESIKVLEPQGEQPRRVAAVAGLREYVLCLVSEARAS